MKNCSLQALSQGMSPLLASAVAAVLGISIIFAIAASLVILTFFLLPRRGEK